MSEKEWQTGPPALRPPSDPAQRAPSEPLPAPREPVQQPIDPELVRQFQQFQQFQELMRQPGGGAPLLPPTQRPRWQRVLRSKPFRWLAILGILVLTAPLWWRVFLTSLVGLAALVFGSHSDPPRASEVGGHSFENTTILAGSPHEAVRKVYQRVADNSADFACGQFNESAKQQFAHDFDFPASTCEEAVHELNARIDKTQRGYKNTWSDDQGLPFTIDGVSLKSPPANVSSVEISSCGVTVSPKLGWFKVEKIQRDQWIITQHRSETC